VPYEAASVRSKHLETVEQLNRIDREPIFAENKRHDLEAQCAIDVEVAKEVAALFPKPMEVY
jgi:hypothetical protein